MCPICTVRVLTTPYAVYAHLSLCVPTIPCMCRLFLVFSPAIFVCAHYKFPVCSHHSFCVCSLFVCPLWRVCVLGICVPTIPQVCARYTLCFAYLSLRVPTVPCACPLSLCLVFLRVSIIPCECEPTITCVCHHYWYMCPPFLVWVPTIPSLCVPTIPSLCAHHYLWVCPSFLAHYSLCCPPFLVCAPIASSVPRVCAHHSLFVPIIPCDHHTLWMLTIPCVYSMAARVCPSILIMYTVRYIRGINCHIRKKGSTLYNQYFTNKKLPCPKDRKITKKGLWSSNWRMNLLNIWSDSTAYYKKSASWCLIDRTVAWNFYKGFTTNHASSKPILEIAFFMESMCSIIIHIFYLEILFKKPNFLKLHLYYYRVLFWKFSCFTEWRLKQDHFIKIMQEIFVYLA